LGRDDFPVEAKEEIGKDDNADEDEDEDKEDKGGIVLLLVCILKKFDGLKFFRV
jgi:hypothetical protein